MKFMPYKLYVFIFIIGLCSGCSFIGQPITNTNKTVSSSNSKTPDSAPTATPKVELNEKPVNEDQPDIQVSNNSSIVKASKGKSDDKINLMNYEKINNGMSLDEVSRIFGDKGMKISDMTINGKHSEMYKWSSDEMTKKIKVTFEKNKVVLKEKNGF